MASICTLLHTWQLQKREAVLLDPSPSEPAGTLCYSWGGDLLVVGIIANYAAVAADTFSSELGILSQSEPRLITSLNLRKVPKGTNGGVTAGGLLAGVVGAWIVVAASAAFLPTCNEATEDVLGGGPAWTLLERRKFLLSMVAVGTLGSVLDSFLGGILQRSVKDVRSGKIVEGDGGVRVLVSDSGEAQARIKKNDDDATAAAQNSGPSRMVESGLVDLLDNNGVNLLMAAMMTVGSMVAAGWYWGVPLRSILEA